MYEEDPFCDRPSNPDARIWRYMDFTKLVHLISTGALHFTRPDGFMDRFEGSLPKPLIEHYRQRCDETVNRDRSWAGADERFSEMFKTFRTTVAVNCWHLNEGESEAMWRLYLKSNEGIAIQSTFARLRDSLASTDMTLVIGRVRYIDYERDMPHFHSPYSLCLHKRISYGHEQELRAIVMSYEDPAAGSAGRKVKVFPESGIDVPVELNVLIERVYVARATPRWCVDVIVSLLRKYELDVPVCRSSLDNDPLW